MCFNKVNIGKYKDVQVAKHNIKCYKDLEYNRNSQVVSPYRIMVYFEKNSKEHKVIKEATFYRYHELSNELHEGLHTYSNRKFANYDSFAGNIYDAIIPKGTRYYYNKYNHEYISEKLIVYNKIKKIKNK